MDREVCWNVFVCRVCAGEKQEELGVEQAIHEFDDSEMTKIIEQVVTELQQEVFTFKAQVADQSGLADAVRAINNLATAQGKKGTPNLIDVKGFGRPKEFSGKKEDFQQWSKKMEAFFAGVIQESEMMLEWSADRTKQITASVIDLTFLCGSRSSSKPGVRAAADAYSTRDSHEL